MSDHLDTPGQEYQPLPIALLLGAIPLVTGVAIFLLWCATSWPWLQGAGMLTILFGVMAFAIGALILLIHFVNVMLRRPLNWRALRADLLVAGVLLLNFPTCGVIVDTVLRLESAQSAFDQLRMSTIRIVNSSEVAVPSVVLSGTDRDGELGPIASEEGVTIALAEGDQPSFRIKLENAEEQSLVVPHNADLVQDTVLVIGADGKATIVSVDTFRWNVD